MYLALVKQLLGICFGFVKKREPEPAAAGSQVILPRVISSSDSALEAARALRAFTEPRCIEIASHMLGGETTSAGIARKMGVGSNLVRASLERLIQSGYVFPVREGREIQYLLASERLPFMAALYQLLTDEFSDPATATRSSTGDH